MINIKKSGGKSTSEIAELMLYAQHDAKELRAQIELIDPDIIICGNTGACLNYLYGGVVKDKANRCANWCYYTTAIGERERLVIDYYHPANRYPALLNYYAIVCIYQQALLAQAVE